MILVNQGRIAEVKDGSKFGSVAADHNGLPPKGPPGIKGRRLREDVQYALDALNQGHHDSVRIYLEGGAYRYDENER